jgi:very-short-patch-repair endonuclease
MIVIPKGARIGRNPRTSKHNARFEDLLAFQMKSLGLPEPARQYPFAQSVKREFLADFAWTQYSLLLEVNGGIWRKGGGAHSHPSNIERDIEKQQFAVLLGFYVLPVTTDEVTSGKAVAVIQQALAVRGWQREGA